MMETTRQPDESERGIAGTKISEEHTFAPEDDTGHWRRLYKADVYFATREEAEKFYRWLEGEGSEAFSAYLSKLERDHPEICYNCRYFDQGNAQCYDGHLQYPEKKTCEWFESLTEE